LPPVSASRYITGYGVSYGGISAQVVNRLSVPVTIIYLDVFPWYLRVYTHTLTIKTNDGETLTPRKLYYKPARDRERPHHLEFMLTLMPKSTTTISIEYDRAFLRWNEFPPDANHGVYVDSAVISIVMPTVRNITLWPDANIQFTSRTATDSDELSRIKYFTRIHTEALLVSLPTPDFSMPYNVICLVSTVVSLAFGPIHNLTTRWPRKISQDEALKQKKSLGARLKGFFSSLRKKGSNVSGDSQNIDQNTHTSQSSS